MWIRRSPLIVSEWAGPDTFVRHLGTGLVCTVGSEVLSFLDGLGCWQQRAVHACSGAPITRMLQLGLLEASDAQTHPDEDCGAREIDRVWAPLGRSARAYHYQSLDAPYLTAGPERDEAAQRIAGQARPFVPKRYESADYVALPAGESIQDARLELALLRRRTTRTFTTEPVTWRQLSTVLYYSFAIQGYKQAGPFGRVPVKTSPAAGARHEAEAYVVSLGSDAIEPAVYHYSATDHSVARISDLPAGGISDIVYQQPACTVAPVLIFSTAVLARLSEKYRHPRAYRLWMHDIGHVGQTLALTATALGLGVFQTISFRDSEFAALIGANPGLEFPSYLFALGHPDNRPEAPAADEPETAAPERR